MSASWVALAYMIWNQMVTHEHMLVIGVLMIVSVIRMTISSTFMPIVLAGTVPITIAVVHLAVTEGDAVHYGMAIFAIATELYSLQIARNLNSTARHMLDYRAQKDGLIAELEQARVNSDAARKRAEQASAAKSHFLATMSHELRTPLNAILGFSEVMKDELMGAHTIPCYKEYAHDIHRSGEYLLNLINQVLDHSRVEAGRYQLHETPVSLQFLGTDCKELLLLKAREKGIALVEKYEPNLPDMLADERAIKQIWLNLISNAVKFTPRGGAITLAVGHTLAGGLYFAVHDTGPGIPADEIPRVLSSFGQGSLSYETAQEGAGLGLPIVRGLVELHGGTFTLTSTPGAGTQAHAEFPRSRIVRTATPAPHAAPPLAATG
jgi:two-component system cell cycle sensor histidine kinase PleC